METRWLHSELSLDEIGLYVRMQCSMSQVHQSLQALGPPTISNIQRSPLQTPIPKEKMSTVSPGCCYLFLESGDRLK